ncbi:hypothetical protein, partial [Salmonella sp. s51228]|uniref:hypothetical protein n=1 Tax=Salmonella sp. s51228 TaxID=3159652 RepID=UPI00397FF781
MAIVSSNLISLSIDADFEVNVQIPRAIPKLSENFTIKGVMTFNDGQRSIEFDFYHTRKRIPVPGSTLNFAYGEELIDGIDLANMKENFTIFKEYRQFGLSRQYFLIYIADRTSDKIYPICDVKTVEQGMPMTWDWLECTSTYSENQYYLDVFGEQTFIEFQNSMPSRIERT